MKKLFILSFIIIFAFFSCGKKESTDMKNDTKKDVKTEVKNDTANNQKKDINKIPIPPEKFIKAVKDGNIGGVKDMLSKDPSLVNIKSTDGMNETPLCMAAFRGFKEICEMLIKAGADVNYHDDYGNTPLHNAVRMDRREIVDLLISNKADIFVKNNTQDNLIFDAAYYEHPEMVKYLISLGIDKNERNISGKTAMQVAVEKNRNKIIEALK